MTKGKRKAEVTRSAQRLAANDINWEAQAKRDTMRVARRDYGGGKSK